MGQGPRCCPMCRLLPRRAAAELCRCRSIRLTRIHTRRGSTSTVRRCRSWRIRSARTESCSRSWSGQRQPDVLSSFSGLSREFGLTQEQIGQRTGMARESVSNYMRLLKLPPMVQHYLGEGKLGFSEARVLLQLTDPELTLRIADEAVRKQMSVLQLKDLVDHTNNPMPKDPASAKARWQDPNVREIQMQMERALGVRVRINDRNGKGRIVIEYATLEDFDRVVETLKGSG